MIYELYLVTFERFHRIGAVLDFGIKNYIQNTSRKYYKDEIKSYIFELRFIHGKRYTYEEPFEDKDLGFKELIDKIFHKYIKEKCELVDLIIIYIRM